MKIFLDTADIEAIKRANDTGLLNGVTTNPSKILEFGKDFKSTVKEIASVVDGLVSAEAVADKAEDIVAKAEDVAALADNIAIKVPMTPEGLKASQILDQKGINVNVTMVFSPDQALLAMKTNPTFVSIVLSRLDKIGGDVERCIYDTKTIRDNYGFSANILAASIKDRGTVLNCMKAGVDVISIPESLFFQLYTHPQTTQGLAEFDKAWEKLQEAKLV